MRALGGIFIFSAESPLLAAKALFRFLWFRTMVHGTIFFGIGF
jgi:hypothetical protein